METAGQGFEFIDIVTFYSEYVADRLAGRMTCTVDPEVCTQVFDLHSMPMSAGRSPPRSLYMRA